MASLATSERYHANPLPHLREEDAPNRRLTLCDAVPTIGFTRLTPKPLLRAGMWSESLIRSISARIDAGEDLVAIATSCHVLASEVFALAQGRRDRDAADRAANHCATIAPQADPASARTAILRQQCAEPQRLWNLGLTIPEMSEQLGLAPRVLRELIVRARHHLGVASFPYRTVLTHRPCPQADALRLEDLLRTQYAQAQAWWQAGVDRASIAQRLGLTGARFDATVRKVRRVLGPEWFATRVLAPISDQGTSGGGRAPRCAEDYALIVGLMCGPMQAPAKYGTTAPTQSISGAIEHINRLAAGSQFASLITEMGTAFAAEFAALTAPCLPAAAAPVAEPESAACPAPALSARPAATAEPLPTRDDAPTSATGDSVLRGMISSLQRCASSA